MTAVFFVSRGGRVLADLLNSLARKCQQNDREAWDQLVERLHPRVEGHVLSILRRYGLEQMIGPHLQDIVNYVWKDVIENIHKFEKGNFELWFAYRRVRRVLDYLRIEAKHAPSGSAAVRRREIMDGDSHADPQKRLLFRQVQTVIESLPPKYANMMMLYYWEGLSYKEIADSLGLGHNSIGSLHSRALRKLKKKLK